MSPRLSTQRDYTTAAEEAGWCVVCGVGCGNDSMIHCSLSLLLSPVSQLSGDSAQCRYCRVVTFDFVDSPETHRNGFALEEERTGQLQAASLTHTADTVLAAKMLPQQRRGSCPLSLVALRVCQPGSFGIGSPQIWLECRHESESSDTTEKKSALRGPQRPRCHSKVAAEFSRSLPLTARTLATLLLLLQVTNVTEN